MDGLVEVKLELLGFTRQVSLVSAQDVPFENCLLKLDLDGICLLHRFLVFLLQHGYHALLCLQIDRVRLEALWGLIRVDRCAFDRAILLDGWQVVSGSCLVDPEADPVVVAGQVGRPCSVVCFMEHFGLELGRHASLCTSDAC